MDELSLFEKKYLCWLGWRYLIEAGRQQLKQKQKESDRDGNYEAIVRFLSALVNACMLKVRN